MTINLLLQTMFIGMGTALVLRMVFLLIRKQSRKTWSKPLLKTGISGALLGMAGGYVGYLVSSWVAGFSQHWLVLLLSAILAAFITGWIIQMALERMVWRKLGWG
jgi:hypothetical protein